MVWGCEAPFRPQRFVHNATAHAITCQWCFSDLSAHTFDNSAGLFYLHVDLFLDGAHRVGMREERRVIKPERRLVTDLTAGDAQGRP
jgi:hypothetical protein